MVSLNPLLLPAARGLPSLLVFARGLGPARLGLLEVGARSPLALPLLLLATDGELLRATPSLLRDSPA